MDNLKYTANLTNIQFPTFQNYKKEDLDVIDVINVSGKFNPSSSYVEYHIYDFDLNVAYSNTRFTNYSFSDDPTLGTSDLASTIVLDPTIDANQNASLVGTFYTTYNLFNNILASSPSVNYFISEISADRTELRLSTNALPNEVVSSSFDQYYNSFNTPGVYNDFYLNFGNNILLLGVNLALSGSNIFIKLYEPLPSDINLKFTCWVVEQIAESLSYEITTQEEIISLDDQISISGPNFNLGLNDEINNSTDYTNYTQLLATNLTSSYNQLSTLFVEKELEINVDYTVFSNFVNFSSAQARLENFYGKVSLIESASNQIIARNAITNPSLQVSSSIASLENSITATIDSFDGWEYYMYYESASLAWPKTNSTYPYTLASTGSTAVLTWYGSDDYNSVYYGGRILSASIYDNENQNNLTYSIPEYLRDDPTNQPYTTFIEMIGQFFDNIWLYYQDVTNRYNADNRLDYGISKDLVGDALRSFGLKLYQNNFSVQDLYYAFLGTNLDGTLTPFPGTTGSLPVPAGSGLDYVTNYITASSTPVPQDDVNKSIYKRLYHNLPYLLKKKGTVDSIRLLANIYGIPSTILRIYEFGGKDRINVNDWDQWQDQFNFAFDTSGSYYASSSFQLNSLWGSPSNRPATVEFRFQTRGLPAVTSSILSQSLWSTDSGSIAILRYTGSAYVTSSLISSSAGPIDPYYQYATLDFVPDSTSPTTSASVYLPFYDGGWWSVMITSGSGTFDLYAANSIYNGDDGSTIGFIASSSIADTSGYWSNSTISYFGSSSLGTLFSGSLQEARYYTVALDVNSFKDFVMDPYSIENTPTNSAPNQLAFRASLGGELYTGSVSIHPKVTGSWVATSSFASNSDFWVSASNYVSNVETFFFDQPLAGIKNVISDKIGIENMVLPTGDTLSNKISIQQQSFVSASYTRDINYVEAAFSPQNEINEDIISQLGYFNIGDYIGDPRLVSSSATSYPALDVLRNAYFEKYISNYDLNDYIRLIKFFDNSLFKMIKDFTPAHSSLAAGVVIKQHLLERNKYPVPQLTPSASIAFVGSGSTNIPYIVEDQTITGSIESGFITGSQGGAYADLSASYQFRPVTSSTGQVYTAEYGSTIADSIGLNLTQSFLGFNVTPFGLTAFTQSNAQEFFNGELNGSDLVVEDGNLNGGNPFLSVNTTPILYDLVTRNPAATATYYTASLAAFSPSVAKQNAIDFLITRTGGEGLMQAAFTFQPSGSRTGEITTTVLGTGSGDLGGSKVLYLDKINAVGNFDNVGDGTLVPRDPGLQFRSASVPVADLGPFYENGFITQNREGWANPYVGGTSPFFGMSPTNDAPKDILLVDSEKTGALIIPDQYAGFVFGISSSFAIGQPITLYFEYPLQYNFVGVSVNNTADTGENGTPSSTGTNYTTLWQQVEALTMNWVDKTGTTVAVGSYQGGQPVPVTVAPVSQERTAIYVTGNPVPVIGLSSGENAPFNTTASANSNQNFPVITSPGVNIDFTYNEFNALIDNAVLTAGAPGFYDLDYTQGITIPVNYQTVISASIFGTGSATLAPVQKFNWSSNRSILPRYSGSKMIGAAYNVYTPASGSWPGDQSFGKDPVINYYGNLSFNTDFVQGTYPEMLQGTALNIKNINIYSAKDSSTIIDQNNPEVFNFVIDQYLGFSQSAEIFSNDVSPIKDNSIRSIDGTIGWPGNSVYFIPSQQTFGKVGTFGDPNLSGSLLSTQYGGIVWYNSGTGTGPGVDRGAVVYRQVVDDDDRYATGSLFSSVASASFEISESLNGGNRWFVTLYTQSNYPLQTFTEATETDPLFPFNSGSNYNHEDEFSLASQGVYEIQSIDSLGSLVGGNDSQLWRFKTGSGFQIPETRPIGVDGLGNYSTGSSLGALVWRANPFPQPVIFEYRSDYFPSGLGEQGGYVIPDDFNSDLKASIFALQTQAVSPRVTTAGEIVTTIPLLEIQTAQPAPLAGITPLGTTSTSGVSCPNGTSNEPFGVPGAYVGEERRFVRLDGSDIDYVWDGCFWGQ
jgi:hypothetical protein